MNILYIYEDKSNKYMKIKLYIIRIYLIFFIISKILHRSNLLKALFVNYSEYFIRNTNIIFVYLILISL